MTQTVVSINSDELETLIRQVVKEELVHLMKTPTISLLGDWEQEGPDDPEGDRLLLHEALDVLRKHGDNPDAWTKWEDFEAELEHAEATCCKNF